MKRSKQAAWGGHVAGERARHWLLGIFAALIVAGILSPGDAITAADGAGLPLAALTLLTAVAFCGLCFVGRLTAVPLGLVEASVVALLVFIGVATLISLPEGARPAINMLWQWVGLGVGFLLARQLIRTGAECRAVVAVLLALVLLQSLYGGWQLAVERPADRKIYQRMMARNPNAPLEGLGHVSAAFREDYEARLNTDEPTGSFVLTNSLAGWMASWLIVGIGVLVGAVRQGFSRQRVIVPLALSLVLAAACLIQTHSRTAQLAALVGVALLIATRGGSGLVRGARWLLPGIGLALLALIGLVAMAPWSVLAGPRLSLLYRWEYWQATAAMIRDHWLLGVGPGHFSNFYTLYMLPQSKESIADPHNFLLEVLATAGIAAAAALLLAIGAFFVRVARPRSAEVDAATDPDAQVPSRGALVVVLGAAGGVILAYLLSYVPVVVTDYSEQKLFAGLLIGAAMLWFLWPWVRGGKLPAGLMAIGAAVLLINLLAAGGIGYPGVAGSLWLLMALGLCLTERSNPARAVPALAAFGLFATAIALTAACQWTALLPVMQSRMALEIGVEVLKQSEDQELGDVERKEKRTAGLRWVQEAVQSNPRDERARRELARHYWNAWLADQHEEREEQFETALDRWLELEDRSAAAHKLAGDWLLYASAEAALADRQEELAGRAAAAYRKAVARFPNSGLLHAHLAWAEHRAGHEDEAKHAAAAALRLDAIAHPDRKLGRDVVRLEDPTVSKQSPEALMQQLLTGKKDG